MSYQPYITAQELSGIPADYRQAYALRVSRQIDTLTFNRIVDRFDELTAFQQEIITEVCKELAQWEYDNADMLNSSFRSYSINGVSMQFGSDSLCKENGVIMPSELLDRLKQTGLCYRGC